MTSAAQESGTSSAPAPPISGHKTRAVFDRYNISSERDVRETILKTQAYLKTQPAEPGVLPIDKKPAEGA